MSERGASVAGAEQPDNGRESAERARPGFWRYLPLAIVLLALAAFFGTGLHHALSFESLVQRHDRVETLVAGHRLAALGLYVLVYVAAVTLSIPASAFLTAIGGYLFGWAIGGIVAAVAATLGSASIFLVARTSLGGLLRRRAGERLRSLMEGFERNAFAYLLFLRLMPVVPFWITNLAAVLFGMRLRVFVLATQIGILPTTFAFAFAGSGLDKVIADHEEDFRQCLAAGGGNCRLGFSPQDLLTPELMIALGALSVLALASILVRHWQARRKEGQA
jgi:uncharacterized membrane protein YdjX (TVP38/TMEM64 family)